MAKEKDEFEAVPEEVKSAVEGSTEEEIRERICQTSLLREDARELLSKDPEVSRVKEELKNLMAPYKEDDKARVQTIRYCKSVLEARGKHAPAEKETPQ